MKKMIVVFVYFIIKKIIAMFDSGDAFFIIKETKREDNRSPHKRGNQDQWKEACVPLDAVHK